MATRGYVGRPDADNPTLLHLQLVNSDTDPDYLVPAIVAIHQLTFRGDTTATALLGCVWAYLGVDVTAADTFLPGDVAPLVRAPAATVGKVCTDAMSSGLAAGMYPRSRRWLPVRRRPRRFTAARPSEENRDSEPDAYGGRDRHHPSTQVCL